MMPARICCCLAMAWMLLALGGLRVGAPQVFAVMVAIAALVVCWFLGRRRRLPSMGWILACFAPLVLLALAQLWPLLGPHPWTVPDLAALGRADQPFPRSLEPARTWSQLADALALSCFALAAVIAFRGARAEALARWMIGFMAAFAVLGLVLAVVAPEFPRPRNAGLARATIHYKNHAGALWAMMLPMAALYAARRPPSSRAWWWLAVAVMAVALLFTDSRGAILAAALVMLPLAWTMLPRKRRPLWALVGLALVAAWLGVVGIDSLLDRFERLRDQEGVTVNGRLYMWRAAFEIIPGAGWLGAGGGTAEQAWLRAGETAFSGVRVDHLHSDPVELLLDYGWIGGPLILAGIGWGLWMLRSRSRPEDEPQRGDWRALRRGAWLGLLILAIHSCGEYNFHLPAVVVMATALLVVLAATSTDLHRQDPGRTRWIRLALATVAVLALAGAWKDWPRERDDHHAYGTARLINQRIAADLPWHQVQSVNAILDGESDYLQANALKAWIALNGRYREGELWLARARMADAGLQGAADAAPGHPYLWQEKLRLGIMDLRYRDQIPIAVQRLEAVARGHPESQNLLLQAVPYSQDRLLSDEQIHSLITSALGLDLARPGWFFPMAAEWLGPQGLADRLGPDAPAKLRASSLGWLAESGPLDVWRQARSDLAAPRQLDAWQWPLAAHCYAGRAELRVALPPASDQRAQLAQSLLHWGLPIPQGLETALRDAGDPWDIFVQPLDLAKESDRQRLAAAVADDLHHPWLRGLDGDLAQARQVLEFEEWWRVRSASPRWLVEAALPAARQAGAVGEAERLALVLEQKRDRDWRELRPGVWATQDPATAGPRDCPVWTLVCVAGHAPAWFRGRWSGEQGPVVLIQP